MKNIRVSEYIHKFRIDRLSDCTSMNDGFNMIVFADNNEFNKINWCIRDGIIIETYLFTFKTIPEGEYKLMYLNEVYLDLDTMMHNI